MTQRIAVLSGGVGGAKLVLGLSQILAASDLTIIANTGDDFRHLNLHVSPDIDTLLYTLAGKANVERGWGRQDETWSFMDAVRSLRGEDWFLLGDGDLALHVLRSQKLAHGSALSEITQMFADAWGIRHIVLPMSESLSPTFVLTDEGVLDFQTYFVRRRCAPVVREIQFPSALSAKPAPGVVEAIEEADVVLIAPSNPYLSVDPILAIPEIADAMRRTRAAKVAVSPLIGGQAIKGPTDKLMTEFGIERSNRSIANHYGQFIDGLLIDAGDNPAGLNLAVRQADILMTTLADKIRVAEAALALAGLIAR